MAPNTCVHTVFECNSHTGHAHDGQNSKPEPAVKNYHNLLWQAALQLTRQAQSCHPVLHQLPFCRSTSVLVQTVRAGGSVGVMFAWWVAAAGYRLAQTRNDTWRRVHSHFSTVQTTWIETKSSTDIARRQRNTTLATKNYWLQKNRKRNH